jgi:hypothetical protein
VSRNLPGGTTRYYVSRVEASYYDPAAAYVSIDGHKSDDLRPYVYVTRDYGESWTSISSNLPEYGNVNTVRQDPKKWNLLYAGTEFGLFLSLDGGGSWHRFMPNLPVVRIDDIVVHPRDNDLVLATHGRSVWIMDDVTALQAATDSIMASDVHLFVPRDAVLWKNDIRLNRAVTGNKNWVGENAAQGTAIQYYLGSTADSVALRVVDAVTRETVRDLEPTAVNPQEEDETQGPRVEPGTYLVVLTVDGEEQWAKVDVLEDIWMM